MCVEAGELIVRIRRAVQRLLRTVAMSIRFLAAQCMDRDVLGESEIDCLCTNWRARFQSSN